MCDTVNLAKKSQDHFYVVKWLRNDLITKCNMLAGIWYNSTESRDRRIANAMEQSLNQLRTK